MKYLLTILMIAAGVTAAAAQEVRTIMAAPDAKLYTELIASSEKVVKGAPFTAEVSNESVQTLADGNRIVRGSNAKMYRDGEGRFRRDGSANSGAGTIGYYTNGLTTTITDPVTGTKYLLDDKNKTVRKWAIKPPLELTVGARLKDLSLNAEQMEKLRAKLKDAQGDPKMSAESMKELEKALAAQGKAMTIVTTAGAQTAAVQAELEKAIVGKIAIATTVPGSEMTYVRQGSGYEVNTEQLGTKNVEGVEAEGTRTVTTIPAGAIGNERPIEVVYEKWYSKDLQLIVYSKHSDPRYGDQVYKLTNISRNEPDPSVFAVPSDYKVQAEGYAPAAGSIYKVRALSEATPPTPPTPAVVTVVPIKAPAAPRKAQQ
jgi:hypothetical protein